MPVKRAVNHTAKNKRFSNAVNASKRKLNNMYNTIKKRYNRGNRSNTLKRMAAMYTSAKNTHKTFLTGNYTRSNRLFKKPTRLNAIQYFKNNPNAYENARMTEVLMNHNNDYASTATTNVLASGRNVFEDFNFSNMPELELAHNENNATLGSPQYYAKLAANKSGMYQSYNNGPFQGPGPVAGNNN